jgi:hypothetical protein
MNRRAFFVSSLAAALAARAQPAHAQVEDLDKLFALFATQGERRKAFVERRHSVLFRNPPETRGTLYFKPPTLLEREVTSPRREKVRIEGENVTLWTEDEGGKVLERKASLATIPQLANLVLTIRSTLAGDLATLRKMFRVTLQAPLPKWRIELTPIDEPVANAVSMITMSGDRGEVDRIQFTETSGDRTELLLSPAR